MGIWILFLSVGSVVYRFLCCWLIENIWENEVVREIFNLYFGLFLKMSVVVEFLVVGFFFKERNFEREIGGVIEGLLLVDFRLKFFVECNKNSGVRRNVLEWCCMLFCIVSLLLINDFAARNLKMKFVY